MPSTFLVVDDEPDLELLIRQKFRKEIRSREYAFEFARNGAEALEIIDRNPSIDVVLTDLNMPVMDGLALLTRLSERDTPIQRVVISSYGDLQKVRWAMNQGAFDFLTKPIDFADLETTMKKSLRQVELLKAMAEAKVRIGAVERELAIAREIQKSILPSGPILGPGFEAMGIACPAREVGGDFFDYFPLPGKRVGVVLGDVSGKGVPGAMIMTMVRTLVRGIAQRESDPATVMEMVNRQLLDENRSGLFVTAFYGTYSPEPARLTYALAGHDSPWSIAGSGQAKELIPGASSFPLGISEEPLYHSELHHLTPGERILVFSDGVIDAPNPEGKMIGRAGVGGLLGGLGHHKRAECFLNALLEGISRHSGDANQHDDITVLALGRNEAQSPPVAWG